MDKQELIDLVATDTEASKDMVSKILDSVLTTIKTGVQHGNTVQLTGFGSFSVGQSAGRTGRDAKTGEPVTIKASRTVKFNAGKSFKDELNHS
ncbi:HU family DNA-binding protein [Streptomyces anulatus]|uniref:HU family DNA-binding protein n=1 Tax=Streptomyces anulatus TaxID=1892 RepID=UPI0033FED418